MLSWWPWPFPWWSHPHPQDMRVHCVVWSGCKSYIMVTYITDIIEQSLGMSVFSPFNLSPSLDPGEKSSNWAVATAPICECLILCLSLTVAFHHIKLQRVRVEHHLNNVSLSIIRHCCITLRAEVKFYFSHGTVKAWLQVSPINE